MCPLPARLARDVNEPSRCSSDCSMHATPTISIRRCCRRYERLAARRSVRSRCGAIPAVPSGVQCAVAAPQRVLLLDGVACHEGSGKEGADADVPAPDGAIRWPDDHQAPGNWLPPSRGQRSADTSTADGWSRFKLDLSSRHGGRSYRDTGALHFGEEVATRGWHCACQKKPVTSANGVDSIQKSAVNPRSTMY